MRSVVAVGVFDGLHRGHLEILGRAVSAAKALDVPAVVVSFDPHPDVVLAKSFQALPPLTPLPEKRARLERIGVDRLEVLPFTRELAALEPEAFVERHLVAPFGPHALVVGENFALGRGRAGDVNRLRAIGRTSGFTVDPVPLLELEGEPVTSSRIRRLLAEGRVREAARLLGRPYGLGGIVVTGDAIGRTLGVPTANLRLNEEKLIPGFGIYAVWTRFEPESRWRPGAMSIGVRPTFGENAPTLEVHVLDWSGELVGKRMEVEFVDWIRAEQKFDSTAALVTAMQKDLERARTLLASEPRSDAVAPASR